MNDIFSKEFNSEVLKLMDDMLKDSESELNSEKGESRIILNNLVLDYLRRMGKDVDDYEKVIPTDFNELDTSVKINILNECKNNSLMIEQSKLYNSSIEGSYDSSNYENSNRLK